MATKVMDYERSTSSLDHMISSAQLRTTAQRLRQFFRVMRWLYADAMRNFRVRLVMTLVIQVVGLFATLGALGVVVLFAQALESGRVIDVDRLLGVDGGTFSARAEPVLFGVSLFAGVGIVVGGVLAYVAEKRTLMMAADYEAICIRRAAANVSALPMSVGDIAGWSLTRSFVNGLIGNDSRICGRGMRSLTERSIAPLALLALVGVMVWLDWVLAAVVLGLAAVLGPLVLSQSLAAAKTSRRFEVVNTESKLDGWVLENQIANGVAPGSERHKRYDTAVDHSLIRRRIDAFAERLRVERRSGMYTYIAFGVMLFLVLWIGGARAISGEQSWTRFITFIIVVRVSLGYLNQFTGMVAQLSRFYPSVARHVALREIARSRQTGADLPADTQLEASVSGPLPGAESQATPVRLTPGRWVAVVTEARCDRFLVPKLARVLHEKREGHVAALLDSVSFVSGVAVLGTASLRETFGLPEFLKANEAAEELEHLDWVEVAGTVRTSGLDRTLTPQEVDRFPPDFIEALQTLAAITTGTTSIICTFNALQRMSESGRQTVADRLVDRLVLVCYPPKVGTAKLWGFNEHGLFVLDDDRVLLQVSEPQRQNASSELQWRIGQLRQGARRRAHAVRDTGRVDTNAEGGPDEEG